MPGNDGTGPLGRGPMTGRGLGPCGRGFRRGAGFGRGMGFGGGMGFRGFAPVPQGQYYSYEPTKEEEVATLRADREAIKADLEAIDKRLSELEKKK